MSEQTLQDELRALRDLVRASRDGFLNGQPYILTYTDIEERLTDLLGEQMWPCPDCDSLGTEHAPNCKRLAALLAKQAAPASQPGVSADQLRQASEQAFMNIPDPHTSSAHFNEMARLLNAALAAVPQPAAAPAEPSDVPDLYRLAYVPGVWRCPKCEFQLTKSTINPTMGAIGTSETDRQSEECPNDGTWMVPVTYKEVCMALDKRLGEEFARREGAAQRDRELIERAVKGTLDTVRSFACEADERSILMLNPKKLASAIAIAEKVPEQRRCQSTSSNAATPARYAK